MRIVVGDVVSPKDHPQCKYRLSVKSMSGDADEYHTNEIDFDSAEIPDSDLQISLQDILEVFVAFLKLDHNTQCDVIDDPESFIKTLFTGKEKIEALLTQWCELVGNDVTCEGRGAHLQGFKVTYFNRNGIEHNVTIED